MFVAPWTTRPYCHCSHPHLNWTVHTVICCATGTGLANLLLPRWPAESESETVLGASRGKSQVYLNMDLRTQIHHCWSSRDLVWWPRHASSSYMCTTWIHVLRTVTAQNITTVMQCIYKPRRCMFIILWSTTCPGYCQWTLSVIRTYCRISTLVWSQIIIHHVLLTPGSSQLTSLFFNEFADLLDRTERYSSTVIMGDVNIHLDNPTDPVTIEFT